jgi:membrane associated rhomboid family serine protease
VKIWRRIPKRYKRVGAFTLGAGIAFLGAGSIYGYTAFDSALFGATGAVLGLVMALSFNYAGKGIVDDRDFDSAMSDAISSVASKTKKDDK